MTITLGPNRVLLLIVVNYGQRRSSIRRPMIISQKGRLRNERETAPTTQSNSTVIPAYLSHLKKETASRHSAPSPSLRRTRQPFLKRSLHDEAEAERLARERGSDWRSGAR